MDINGSDLDEDTNFFEEGGDSVEALRLVAAAEAMDLSLDIEDLFNYPTLGALATNCQEAGHVSKPKTQLAKYPSLIKTLCVHAQLPARSHVTRSRTFHPASMFQTVIYEKEL